MKQVKIYSTPICPYCHTLKEFLKENNIQFQEFDVSQDEKARDYIVGKTNRMEVPIIEIDEDIVLGFDREKISNLLDIKN